MSHDPLPPDDRTFPEFDRDINKSLKKYRNCRKDVDAFARLVDALPDKHRGVQMSGFHPLAIYKARVISQDINAGKSGGFRVILLEDDGLYRFVMIYTHNSEPREDKLRKEISHRLMSNGFL